MFYFRFSVRLLPPKIKTIAAFDRSFSRNFNYLTRANNRSLITGSESFPFESERRYSNKNTNKNYNSSRLLVPYNFNQQVESRSMSSKGKQDSLIISEITKNLVYFSENPRPIDKNTLKFKDQSERPLALLISWMFSTDAHIAKYAKIYTDLGFEAVAIKISGWQLMWPVKGAQVATAELLKFLDNNPWFQPIVVHGFSVGGYVFGEVMVHMARNMEKYKPLLAKFQAQIWDSAADITEIPTGFPIAVFPNNPMLQKAFRRYVIYHMKTFHEQATVHYMRSSQSFHHTLVKAPALFLLCKNDPIGAEKSNLSVKEDWEAAGIKCTWKCWDRSTHVLHYKNHRDEYLKLLYDHLETNVLGKMPEKFKAKL